jgi:hypothetical protein
LESVCWGNSTVGSNPTLSAIISMSFKKWDSLQAAKHLLMSTLHFRGFRERDLYPPGGH